MSILRKMLLAILIMSCLLPVSMAQPNIAMYGQASGQTESFEFSLHNFGSTGAYVLPVVYYWNGAKWVMAQNAKAVGTGGTLTPTPAGNGYSYIWMNPGDGYIIYTQQVIPSGNQWIAWDAWWWDGSKWVAVNPKWNEEQYIIYPSA